MCNFLRAELVMKFNARLERLIKKQKTVLSLSFHNWNTFETLFSAFFFLLKNLQHKKFFASEMFQNGSRNTFKRVETL